MEDEDNETKLNNEVSWCIDQLLQSINSGKLSERKGKNIGSKIGCCSPIISIRGESASLITKKIPLKF